MEGRGEKRNFATTGGNTTASAGQRAQWGWGGEGSELGRGREAQNDNIGAMGAISACAWAHM